MSDEPIVIEQDREVDDGEVMGLLDVFWARGHGHDPVAFIRAVVDHCLDEDQGVPRIAEDVAPIETWQQNVAIGDGIEYRRDSTPPKGPRSPRFPITLLDLDRRGPGSRKCAIKDCGEPWSISAPIQVAVEVDQPDHLSVEFPMCRTHYARLPASYYRMAVVPVGAHVWLPGYTTAVLDAARALVAITDDPMVCAPPPRQADAIEVLRAALNAEQCPAEGAL